MFEKNLTIPCLLDIYGSLLTDRKRELLDYYYEEDYSLSEIAELTGLSRQGIRDSLKKSEGELVELESKLHLYEKKQRIAGLIALSRDIHGGDGAEVLKLQGIIAEIESLL